MPRATFAALALCSAALACADAPTTAPARAPMRAVTARDAFAAQSPAERDAERTRRRLERAAEGLLYTSESDYPFDYVDLPADARAPLTEAAFRAAAGVPPDSAVERRTLDEFFARHIERVDPADSAAVALVPRYRRFKRVLRRELRGVTVFRVGQVAIRCFVVGVDGRGHLVGFVTTAIET